jgi:dihydrofolate synthase/folylpolyglutamate synthase
MTQINSLFEAEQVLEAYMPLAHAIIGKDLSLERMRPLMEAVGNPEKRLKVVHVAGTSGKTSTAYYAAAILSASGKKVGLTVSPHMDYISERVQIHGAPLDEATFCAQLTAFLKLVERSGVQPTYYEVLMAFAYWYFDKAGVDYAVIETGLGGLHDGSNVAERPDKVCIITDIGYDHMHILGNTIAEIAAQKAGIIHSENHAFMHMQSDEVMNVFSKYCSDQHAYLHSGSENTPQHFPQSDLSTLPLFKQRNWVLAHEACCYVATRDAFIMPTSEKLRSTLLTYVPGRMDEVNMYGTTVVMDGAHNEQKMASFVESFKMLYGNRPVVVLFAMIQTKDYASVLKYVQLLTDTIVCTRVNPSGGLKKGAEPDLLAIEARKAGIKNVSANVDQKQALNDALQLMPENGVLVITGSLYLLSHVRQQNKELIHG